MVQGPGAGPEVTAAVCSRTCWVAAGESAVIARAFAPASVANVAVGFDILGHAIAGIGDTVSVRRIDEPAVRIDAIRGSAVALPLDAAGNTAGAALMSLREGLGLDFGFAVEIDKGIRSVPAWRFGSVECRGAGRRQCAAGCAADARGAVSICAGWRGGGQWWPSR